MDWANRLQLCSKGVVFYGPTDSGNPQPGQWTVVGPTDKQMASSVSIDRASFMYLVHFSRDEVARAALKKERAPSA